GELDTLFVERGDPDWNMFARSLEAHRETALQLEQLAFVVQRRLRHYHVDNFHVLLHPRQRRIERNTVEMFDHLRTAGAQSDDHAAVAQLVERAEMLRERGRRA